MTRPVARWVSVLATTAAVGGLGWAGFQPGTEHPGRWASQQAPAIAVAAAIWALIVILGCYLLAVGAAAALCRLAGWPWGSALALRLIPPSTRLLLGVTVMASSAVGPLRPAAAAGLASSGPSSGPTLQSLPAADSPPNSPSGPPPTLQLLPPASTGTSPPTTAPPTTPATTPRPTPPTPAPSKTATVPPPTPFLPPTTWTVRSGDSLWSIAEEALTTVGHPSPAEASVAHYWAQIISINRAHLPDPDNPDLIFPGEQIILPTPST